MAYKRNVEIFEESYEKKDSKSVLSYVSRDGRKRYIAGEQDPSGVNPMPHNGITVTTWQELKDKRDAGKLIPGSLYRITDYQCTTTQENTRSAGHQFDIVLLALSNNKLAEEGWAMMHDNVYDVTFADGVRKVYILKNDDNECNIVDVETLLGFENYIYHTDDGDPEVEVNWENHTATDLLGETFEQALTEENIPYNYFQNSNLSAWKVWYCLDNDTARFAWADDSVDEGSPASIISTFGEEIYYRDESKDKTITFPYIISIYGWTDDNDSTIYTASTTPNVGDKILKANGTADTATSITSYTPAHEGTGLPNGRGVIYRLIDEWNNDVGYDFKNIQFVRKLTNGEYNDEGEITWCYTFNAYNLDNDICEDLSVIAFTDDLDGSKNVCVENKHARPFSDINMIINESCHLTTYSSDTATTIAHCTIIDGHLTLSGASYCILLSCSGVFSGDGTPSIYIQNKKVLTEE